MNEPDPNVHLDTETLQNRMREDWDRRARENAYHYISTGKDVWSKDTFFETGRQVIAEEILTDMGNICQGKPATDLRVLEIGCGAGRLTRALAETFGEVHGVDVSDEMVALARANLGDLSNVHLDQNNGADLAGLPGDDFDFAFSYLVFQHISSRAIIESYVREVWRVLKPGSLFKLQLQGHPDTHPEDGDTWIGLPYSLEQVSDLAADCGFELRYQHGAGTQYFWLWFFKPPAL